MGKIIFKEKHAVLIAVGSVDVSQLRLIGNSYIEENLFVSNVLSILLPSKWKFIYATALGIEFDKISQL